MEYIQKGNNNFQFLLCDMNVKEILIPKSDFKKFKQIILNIGGMNTLNITQKWLDYIYYDNINDNINFTKYFFDKLLIQLGKYMEFRLEFYYKDEYLTQDIYTEKKYININDKIDNHYIYSRCENDGCWTETKINNKNTCKDYLTQKEFDLCTCKRENGIRICDCIEFEFSFPIMGYKGETPQIQIHYTSEFDEECDRILNEIEFIENDVSTIKTNEYCVKVSLQKWIKRQKVYEYKLKQPILLSEYPNIDMNHINIIHNDLAIFQNILNYQNHTTGTLYSY